MPLHSLDGCMSILPNTTTRTNSWLPPLLLPVLPGWSGHAPPQVFAEKPLCCEPMEAPALFAEAEKNNVLLFTALNRRHDPQILAAKKKLESGEMGRPLSITLLSGDYPYPSPLYLRTCGTLYQDCSIHDFDYVTWLLGEEPRALRSKGHTSDEERSQGTFEHACTHMSFKSGVEATFIHTRVAPSYDHRLDITCEKGTIQVVNPPRGEKPMTFRQRFDDSYIAQMSYFLLKVRSGDVQPNITLERTQMLESLSESCLESARDKNAEIRFDEHAKARLFLRDPRPHSSSACSRLRVIVPPLAPFAGTCRSPHIQHGHCGSRARPVPRDAHEADPRAREALAREVRQARA